MNVPFEMAQKGHSFSISLYMGIHQLSYSLKIFGLILSKQHAPATPLCHISLIVNFYSHLKICTVEKVKSGNSKIARTLQPCVDSCHHM